MRASNTGRMIHEARRAAAEAFSGSIWCIDMPPSVGAISLKNTDLSQRGLY
ncbi:MAG: hypothetical protein BWZ10_00650 [candidate division BRC1 bacterium ADurb.BinA364]|nr:MAG: hypothetical protein BWZ10_00650 [candidate division BRC1 bacterium ADurb.BinA364]